MRYVALAAALCLTASSAARAQSSDSVRLSFDHVLSIFEWRALVDYSTRAQFDPKPSLGPITDLHLAGLSRFLEQDSITTTDASGYINAMQPVWGDRRLDARAFTMSPFLTLAGNSYVTTPRPGSGVASVISRQASGFALAGLHSDLPESNIGLSIGAGLVRQTQSAFGAIAGPSLTPSAPSLAATGLILRSDDSAPNELLNEGVLGSSMLRVDERFFAERSERYSNDSLRFQVLSGFEQRPNNPQPQNAASLLLALQRRDFFFDPDSASGIAKQERTEYSLALGDSLGYPIVENKLRARVSLELEPRDVTRRSDAASAIGATSSLTTLSTLMAPSEVSSLRAAGEAALTYDPNAASATPGNAIGGEARMRYEERTENVRLMAEEMTGSDPSATKRLADLLDEASYSSRSTTAGLVLRYAPSIRDATELEGTARILSYDTPSILNDDDHDDLLTAVRLRYQRFFSNATTGDIELRASRDHLVYLKSDRSAQNAVTRSLVLSSQAMTSSPALLASVTGEVFANYTEFDYLGVIPLLATGDYVLRGMTLSDSIALPILRPWLRLEQGIALRISERGSYNADAFSERRDTRVTELSASLLAGISGATYSRVRWDIRAGARAFILSRSANSTESMTTTAMTTTFGEVERQMRIGPAMVVSLTRQNYRGPMLTGSLWYSVLTQQLPSYTTSRQLESHLAASWIF